MTHRVKIFFWESLRNYIARIEIKRILLLFYTIILFVSGTTEKKKERNHYCLEKNETKRNTDSKKTEINK